MSLVNQLLFKHQVAKWHPWYDIIKYIYVHWGGRGHRTERLSKMSTMVSFVIYLPLKLSVLCAGRGRMLVTNVRNLYRETKTLEERLLLLTQTLLAHGAHLHQRMQGCLLVHCIPRASFP